MTIRKIFAVKSHIAMEKVRNTMQPNSRILSVKKVQGGVEVLVDGELVDVATLESNLAQLNVTSQLESTAGTKQ